jgi:hypothetical protein
LAAEQNAASLTLPPLEEEDGVEELAPGLLDELELDDPPQAAARVSTAASVTTQIDLRIPLTPLART